MMAVNEKVYSKEYKMIRTSALMSHNNREEWDCYLNEEDEKLEEEIKDKFHFVYLRDGFLGFDGRIMYHFQTRTKGFPDYNNDNKKLVYTREISVQKAGDSDCLKSERKQDSLSDLEQFLLEKGFKEKN